MNELAFATIKTLREKLAKKEISQNELLSFFINRFKKYDDTIGSAIEVFDIDSLKFKQTDGLLQGIPGIIKDNICQKDRITACATKILSNYVAPYDATATTRLIEAGAVSVGRANCDEFAMGSSTETSAYKKTKNPWDISRVPGGSSGGSAAAVAAGFVPWALGSETGGSVRQPSSYCNLVGLKPTYGLISRFGLAAYVSSIDQIGIFTRTVYDNALILSVVAGHDAHDSTSLKVEPKDYTKSLTGKLKEGLTIGVIDNALNREGIDPEVQQLLEAALKELESQGAKIKRMQFPMLDYCAAVYFMISRAECASNLARYDGVKYGFRSSSSDSLSSMYANTRNEGLGYEVKRRILIGNYVLSVGHADDYYVSAKVVQGLMRKELMDAFKEVDLLFAPGSPAPAFKLGEFGANSLQMDLQDYFTAFANLAGIPGLAVPCGFTKENLPIGFQLVGPELSEELIFQTAHAYEQSMPWHTMHPKGF